MMTDLPQSGSIQLATLLAEMNDQGGFPLTVLTDRLGFPIAFAAAPDQDPQKQAAVVALIQKTAARVHHQLGLAHIDEIFLFDAEGQRLVCRTFNANNHALILAVVVPDKKQSYRRLTNKAIKAIQQAWKL